MQWHNEGSKAFLFFQCNIVAFAKIFLVSKKKKKKNWLQQVCNYHQSNGLGTSFKLKKRQNILISFGGFIFKRWKIFSNGIYTNYRTYSVADWPSFPIINGPSSKESLCSPPPQNRPFWLWKSEKSSLLLLHGNHYFQT